MSQLPFHKPAYNINSDLPVLQKVNVAYKVWHELLPNVPRLTRYSLGEKINWLFIELIELILTAAYSGKSEKPALIQKASIKLDMLKYFLQTAWELKAMDNKQLGQISPPLVEVGKMLGGWKKQVVTETPPG
jgi:hypothetical protein